MPFGIDDALAIGGAVAGVAQNVFGIGEKRQDRRQIEQQEKLTAMQVGANKDLADYNKDITMDIWNKTNTPQQVQKLKEAGLNPALMYKGSGGGGATVSGTAGSAGGGQASSSASAMQANSGMAMTLANLGLIKAQTENIKADTAKKTSGANVDTATVPKVEAETKKVSEDTKGVEWENKVKQFLGAETEGERRSNEADITNIELGERNAKWEMAKALGYEGDFIAKDSPIAKAYLAGFEKTVQDLKNAKIEGDIGKAKTAIENYKAELAKQGIDPDSPWYLKILTTLMGKIGLDPTGIVKGVIMK